MICRYLKWVTCMIILMVNSIQSQCPHYCSCEFTNLVCYKHLPSFIPMDTTSITVYEIPLGNTSLNFSSDGWKHIKQAYFEFGSQSNETDLQTVRNLHDSEFSEVINLKYLKIKCNCLLEFDENAFKGLLNVKELNLNNNRVGFIQDVINALDGKEILPNISTLHLSNISYWELKVDNLDLRDLHYAMEDKPLTDLDLGGTRLRFSNIQPSIILPQLLKLDISNADRAVFSFPIANSDPDSGNNFLPNLQILEANYPRFPTSEYDCELDETYWQFCLDKNATIYKILPNKLKELSVKNLFKTDIDLRGTANKTHLCIENKFFDRNATVCMKGGFDHLERLDLSDNFISYIEAGLIKPFIKLTSINLAKNRLGDAISDENYGKTFFYEFQQVVFLNISDNAIQAIPNESFKDNKKLRILDLSHNKLKTIDFGMDDLISLEYLDISYNSIMTVEAGSCKSLQNMYFRNIDKNSSSISPDSGGNRTKTHVNFKHNPFSCSCENVCLLKFISELNETYEQNDAYTCIQNNKTLLIDDVRARKALYMCKKYIVITVFSVLAGATVVLISVTIYVIVSEKRKAQLKRLREMGIDSYERGHKKYAVFLSFSGDDEDFVMTNVYPNLNSGLKKVLNTESNCVCTGGTDFKPGYTIRDEIVRCIEESAIVVFFLSESFIKKPWCRTEVHKAFLDEKPIVLMIRGKLDMRFMPKALRKHYETFTRVHWSTEHGVPVMRPSWEHLCQTIVGLIGSNEQQS